MNGDLPWPPPPPSLFTAVSEPVLHLAVPYGQHGTLCECEGPSTTVADYSNCVECLRECLRAYIPMFRELLPLYYQMPWFAGDEHIGADLGRRLTESVLPLLPPKEDE